MGPIRRLVFEQSVAGAHEVLEPAFLHLLQLHLDAWADHVRRKVGHQFQLDVERDQLSNFPPNDRSHLKLVKNFELRQEFPDPFEALLGEGGYLLQTIFDRLGPINVGLSEVLTLDEASLFGLREHILVLKGGIKGLVLQLCSRGFSCYANAGRPKVLGLFVLAVF